MIYKTIIIITLIILVCVMSYRCSNESNCYGTACSADSILFQDTYGSGPNVNGSVKNLTDLIVHIETGCAVELSNVLIEVSLPKEVTIKPFLHPEPNEHFDYVNNKVTRKIDKILHISSEMLGLWVKYDSAKWSKPIEVFMSVDYARTVVCPYPALKNGRYTKRRYFLLNEEGTLQPTPRSDKMWTYVGG